MTIAQPSSLSEKSLVGRWPRVLVIDDDPDITWFLKTALAYDEVEVIRDHDGQRGSLDAVQESPDLVLTDLDMPRRDGHDLLKFIRATPTLQDLPVIVITGCSESGVEERVLAEGASGFVRKPIDLTVLRRELEKWIPLQRLIR